MSSIALYRKYRPMLFDDLIGQDHIKEILKSAVKQQKISHAYLFSGPRGTGKTSAARILARAINCEDIQDGEPCNKCPVCKDALDEALTDLIEMDAASHTGVDNVRDIIEKAQFAPTKAKRKVYIIDEVHMLSKPAFNALLKTLEEPPENTYFILATTEPHKILDTIISRCQRFDFRRIGPEHVLDAIKKIGKKENIKTEDEALRIIAHNAGGSLRDALSIFEQISYKGSVTLEGVKQSLGMASSNVVKQFIDAIKDKRVTEALAYVNDLLSEGIDLSQFVNETLLFLREEMLEAVEKDNKEEAKNITELITILMEANYELKDAIISQLPLEMAIIRACKEVALPQEPVENRTEKSHEEKKEEPKQEAPKEKAPVEHVEKKEVSEKEKTDFSLDEILKNIKKASVRTVLRNASIHREQRGLKICVDSDFTKRQLETAENSMALFEGIKKTFGKEQSITIDVVAQSKLSEKDVAEVFGQ